MRKFLAALLLCSCSSPTLAEVTAPTTSQVAPKMLQEVPAQEVTPSRIAAFPAKESVSDLDLQKISLRNNNPCGQWLDTALSVGWSIELWPQQAYIIWRESRCNIDSWNQTDPNGGSRGLMQINGFWCQKWLQAQGVLSSCEQLFDPVINLRASWAIYNYSVGKNDNGWHPWSMSASFDPRSVDD